MKISLNIPDSKAIAFLKFIKTLDYVKVVANEESDIELTDDLKKALDESIQSLQDEGGVTHTQMVRETKKKYPELFK
ncbi:hypothetical protein [Crocinitomix catalasitica]|uniref:hypothetical protein n=1 Tax=Crocinitomix catalasitica TaxID=184607 RepID=UPI000484AF5B|nr:hypothetical protein [Crocinitomix catalasitica]